MSEVTEGLLRHFGGERRPQHVVGPNKNAGSWRLPTSTYVDYRKLIVHEGNKRGPGLSTAPVLAHNPRLFGGFFPIFTSVSSSLSVVVVGNGGLVDLSSLHA